MKLKPECHCDLLNKLENQLYNVFDIHHKNFMNSLYHNLEDDDEG
jgi:hypothetical protein